jgi:hypothetical protein
MLVGDAKPSTGLGAAGRVSSAVSDMDDCLVYGMYIEGVMGGKFLNVALADFCKFNREQSGRWK